MIVINAPRTCAADSENRGRLLGCGCTVLGRDVHTAPARGFGTWSANTARRFTPLSLPIGLRDVGVIVIAGLGVSSAAFTYQSRFFPASMRPHPAS